MEVVRKVLRIEYVASLSIAYSRSSSPVRALPTEVTVYNRVLAY